MQNEQLNLILPLLVPVILIYLAMTLKTVDSVIARKITRDSSIRTRYNGKEMIFMSMALDIVALVGKINFPFYELSIHTFHTVNLIIPGSLLVIHIMLYVVITITNTSFEKEGCFKNNLMGFTIGMTALFTNAWTINSFLTRF